MDELIEFEVLQSVEPVGGDRIEIYLCRILAALHAIGGDPVEWSKLRIGYEQEGMTPEQALKVLNRIENGSNQQS